MKEDYVSFEVAKLLKEKGFKGQYHMYYIEDGVYKCDDLHDIKDYAKSIAQFEYLHRTKVIAPTLQMATKWLREIYNLHVDVGYDDLDWFWNIISISKDVPPENRPKFIAEGTACHRTYEDAVETALKYSLENLI